MHPAPTQAWPLPGGRVLRHLAHDDAQALFAFFESLGAQTRRRFQPHAMDLPTSQRLCACAGGATLRLVVVQDGQIQAYFILEPQVSPHEAQRFRDQGISLEAGRDFMFAPAVTDRLQDSGIASQAMPHLLALAGAAGARSLVLMGGTQATNARAIAFYEKFSFQRHGGYATEVFNHDMRCMIDTGAAAGTDRS